MKHIASIILFILIFSSCGIQTRYISMDIRKPAPVTFPQGTKKILLLDNTYVNNSAGTNSTFYFKDQGELTDILIDSLKPVLLYSLEKYMNEEKLYDTVEVHPYYIKPVYAYYREGIGELPLTREEITKVCAETGADAVISLDCAAVFALVEDKMIKRTIVGAKVRSYSSEGDTLGVPVEKMQSMLCMIHKSKEHSVYMQQLVGLVKENTEWVADLLTDAYIPKWVTQERIFYKVGREDTHITSQYIDKGDWKGAAKLWEELYNAEQKNMKKKALLASNLALAYEYMDDVDQSLKWVNIAFNTLPKEGKGEQIRYKRDGQASYIMKYRTKIQERVKDMPLLKKQLE